MFQGGLTMTGTLVNTVTRGKPPVKYDRWAVRRWHLKNWLLYRWRELPFMAFLCVLPILRWFIPALCVLHGKTSLVLRRGDGTVLDFGIVGRHLVVTAGKQFVASAFDNTVEVEILKYHGWGTGTNAAASGDTGLQTEFTTEYATNSTRPTGSQAHSAATYTTVGTFAPDSGGTLAVTEWGLLSSATVGAGTLFDRQVFAAVNLVAANGDTLASSYVLTLS